MQDSNKIDQRDRWQAELKLDYQLKGNKTFLAKKSQKGPLTVQRPFYPEGGICHNYILHPPGGVVGGDELQIQLKANRVLTALLQPRGLQSSIDPKLT